MKPEFKDGKNVYKHPITGRPVVGTYFDTEVNPSLTHQQFKDECDVNIFIKKQQQLNKTAFDEWFNSPPASGVYADFTNLPSFQEAADTIAKANEAFDALPVMIRQRFEYNPQMLMDFLSDENNIEESIKLGLRVVTENPPPTTDQQLLNQIVKNTTPQKRKARPQDDEE